MDAGAFFSEDYGAARERFRAAVARLGLPLESHVIAAKGPRGEALSIDTATLGPAHGRTVLIVSSGIHGVEGFLGSAAQLAWLAGLESAAAVPEGLKIVLVHALNPYGFAWLRRWNENNVDLNRNFLSDRTFIAGPRYRDCLEVYDRLFAFLNPACPPSLWEPYALKTAWHILAAGADARRRLPADLQPSRLALGAISQLGLAELEKVLLVGQYHHRRGLFYGGDGLEESTAWLIERLPAWVAGAALALHLDLHSGLGPWGECTLLVADESASPRTRGLADQIGTVRGGAAKNPASYMPTGSIASYFHAHLDGGIYHGLTAEFGTYKGIRVFGALRAENQAHFYADPDSPAYRRAKRQVREAFAPADAAWRRTALARALVIVVRAIEVCRGAAPAQPANRASSSSPW